MINNLARWVLRREETRRTREKKTPRIKWESEANTLCLLTVQSNNSANIVFSGLNVKTSNPQNHMKLLSSVFVVNIYKRLNYCHDKQTCASIISSFRHSFFILNTAFDKSWYYICNLSRFRMIGLFSEKTLSNISGSKDYRRYMY